MIKVKDGYAKLIGTTYQGSATQVLLSNGGNLEFSSTTKANTLVQRNASQHIYATYFNSAISDEALTDIGSVYVRNTSDTFIRRISKTQFYSIIDNKFVTLDTAQTITGVKTFSTGPILANNATITQNQNSTSNYTIVVKWLKGGTSQGTYNPSIGQHNTGGDGTGSICILPYPTSTDPWSGTVGLFISKGVLKLDGKSVALAENYYNKTESDGRYVNVTGDTMTGPLIVKATVTGTQLISTIAAGTSPLKVTSTTVVTNLNSDLFDGFHETAFVRSFWTSSPGYDCSKYNSRPLISFTYSNNAPFTGGFIDVVTNGYGFYLGTSYSSNAPLYYKKHGTSSDGGMGTWQQLARITDNVASATKLQTARTINGTLFDGTSNITTAYWGTARTITLSGAVTGSASVNGSQNVTIATTYQTGSIDGRYVGGNKTANHGSSGTAYTADSYSSTFARKEFVAFAERGSWAYANNGYVTTNTGVNIPLAGTAVFQWGASDTNKTQLFITPHNNSGVSNPAANEMLFYTSNGSGYTSAWTRVLTHRNYTAYTVTKTGGGASGTWGISITGSAPWANITGKPTLLTLAGITSLTNKDLNYARYNFGTTNKGNDSTQLNVPANYGLYLSLAYSDKNQGGQIFFNTVPGTTGTLYFRTRNAGDGNTVNTWKSWKTVLDSSNYTAYFNPANYVTALGTNGNYVTWTKNGATNNLTVPYATKANRLTLVSCYNGTTNNDLWSSIKTTNSTYIGTATIYEVYNDGGPTTYGEVLDIVSMHSNHWQPQLWFDSGKTGSIRHRNKNYNDNTWGSWYVLLDNNNYASVLDGRYVTSLGTNGNYLTWVKNGSTNNITVPYATTSAYLTNGFSAAFVNKWDCNAPDRVVYSDYGSSGRSVTNAPSGWNYGTLLELGHINYRGLNGTLNIQLMWDVAHNTTSPGTLWFRGKDSVKGWAKSWAKVITDQNISSILSNYYTKSESDGKYVTLTTAQTISGSKTFTTGIKFSVNNNGDANLGAGDGFKLFYNNTSGSNFPGSYYNVASFMTGYTGFQLACYGGADQALKYRHRQNNGTWHPWLTLAFTSQLKDPVNYYWANIKVSASSSTGTSPTFSTAYTSNWFRSTGSTGWYSETYRGGWHMTDTTYIRAYNNKRVYNANTSQYAFYTSGGMTATGGFWHSAVNSNSYVLLAGGSYKGLGDFAKGNAGSATKGVYVTGGTVTAMTYSLSSNLNSGTSGKLAYYSAATTVASYTSTVGATNRGIYMNAGVPSVMTYYLNATVNSGTSGKLAYYSGANALSSYTPNIGSAYQPVYINAGTPGICPYSFLGSYFQPIVLVSGYFYRSSTNSNSWYYQGYKHSQIGSPTFYLNGGVMRLAFSNSSSVSFISATAQGRRNFAGRGTSITQPYDGSSGDYGWRSEGAYWFNSYVMNNNNTSYLYVRAYRLANSDNDSWYSGGSCWRSEEDAIESVAFTIFGYIYP